jgi:hypothetical protein
MDEISALQSSVGTGRGSTTGQAPTMAVTSADNQGGAFEGPRLDIKAYREFGLFVIRNFFPTDETRRLCGIWQEFYEKVLKGRRVVGANGASAQDLSELPPQAIRDLYRHPLLIELMKELYGNDIVFCQQRVLIKDDRFSGGVPPHQDFSYYRGGMEKTGMFIPLTVCGPDNGGLHFILRSHKFGYLGDRGYIPPDRLVNGSIPGFDRVCPTLRPGDVALMDICLFHFSENATVPDPRVYVNPYYQPATDGAYDGLISGTWKTDVLWHKADIEKYFKTNTEIFSEQMKSSRWSSWNAWRLWYRARVSS